MGQLFNRSQMHKLEGLMLHHISTFVRAIAGLKGQVDLTPACRALEADIICKQALYLGLDPTDTYYQPTSLSVTPLVPSQPTRMVRISL